MHSGWVVINTAILLSGSACSLAAPSGSQPPPCPAAQLSFALDDENGYFDGMSHSGTLLVLRNLGPNDCSVPAQPTLGFEDAEHHPLPITPELPRGMHPGPVIPPVVIPVGAEVTSQIRWVSSDAFGANNSVSPAFVTLWIGSDVLRLKFTGQMFGPAGKHPSYSIVTRFKPDPVYKADSP
jgi:hypothetical protein